MRKIFITFAIVYLSVVTPLSAQTELEAAAAGASKKLDDALQRLASMRDTIGSEKVPIAMERDQLFSELQALRREADRAQRLSDNQGTDLSTFEANLKAHGEMIDYLINLSSEFARTLGSQLDPSEAPVYQELITTAESAAEDPNLEPLEKLIAQQEILTAGIDRMEQLSGGALYPGEAITESGLLEKGTFVRFGPITFFSGDSGVAGLARQGKSVEPVVASLEGGRHNAGIATVAQGETAMLPLDATLTNALAIAATKETLVEHIRKGGIWIYPILLFAGLSLVVAAFKAFEIISLPTPKEGILADVLSKLASRNKEEAIKSANSADGPLGKMLQQGVRYSDHDPELVEEIMYETMVETQPKVMRLLPFISVTAAVAPLLGLLGTVTGMINTFNRIKIFGTGDAKSLSGGISEALITTEFGLIVAIPSLLLYAILSRKAKSYLARMEKMSISFINGIKTIV